jgi:hypothetical protein
MIAAMSCHLLRTLDGLWPGDTRLVAMLTFDSDGGLDRAKNRRFSTWLDG